MINDSIRRVEAKLNQVQVVVVETADDVTTLRSRMYRAGKSRWRRAAAAATGSTGDRVQASAARGRRPGLTPWSGGSASCARTRATTTPTRIPRAPRRGGVNAPTPEDLALERSRRGSGSCSRLGLARSARPTPMPTRSSLWRALASRVGERTSRRKFGPWGPAPSRHLLEASEGEGVRRTDFTLRRARRVVQIANCRGKRAESTSAL